MHWFAIAALINYSNLKQHKLPYGCEGQKFETGLEGLKSRCLQTCGPSGGSRGKPVPHPSHLLEHRGGPHSLACGHIIPTSASVATSSLTQLSFSLL